MKHPTTSFEISLKDLQNYTQNRLFYQSLLICFLVPEKRIIFAKVQRRKRGKIRLSYHLSFKLLVVNWSNMLFRKYVTIVFFPLVPDVFVCHNYGSCNPIGVSMLTDEHKTTKPFLTPKENLNFL